MLIGMFGTGSRDPDAVLRAACTSSADSFWLAPRFRNTVFQDAAMGMPWSADGDPVGAVLDKGGRGYAFTQATAASRPLGNLVEDMLVIDGDGADDIMQAGDVCELHNRSAVVVVALQPPPTGEVTGFLVGKGTTSISTTAYRTNRAATGRFQAHYSNGSTFTALTGGINGDIERQILTVVFDRAAGVVTARRNGVVDTTVPFTPDEATDRDVTTQLKLLGNIQGNNNWNGSVREALVLIRPAANISTAMLEDIEQRLIVAHGVETGGG